MYDKKSVFMQTSKFQSDFAPKPADLRRMFGATIYEIIFLGFQKCVFHSCIFKIEVHFKIITEKVKKTGFFTLNFAFRVGFS